MPCLQHIAFQLHRQVSSLGNACPDPHNRTASGGGVQGLPGRSGVCFGLQEFLWWLDGYTKATVWLGLMTW